VSLAGLATVGSAAATAATGGQGLILRSEYQSGVPFTFDSWGGDTTFNTTCLSAGSPVIDWVDGCVISYGDGGYGTVALPARVAQRLDSTATYAFVAARPCPADTLGDGVLAVEFRPVG